MKQAVLVLYTVLQASCMFAQPADSSYRNKYYDDKLIQYRSQADTTNEVIWLGDSITDSGEWDSLFPGRVVLNRGISGDNTYGVLHRLQEVIDRKPAIVFILIGTNDIARNISVKDILSNYETIIRRIKAGSPETRIVVQSIMPVNTAFPQFPKHHKLKQQWEYNQGLRLIASREAVSFLDLTTPFQDANGMLDAKYTTDGLHLNRSGYQLWKELVLKSGFLE